MKISIAIILGTLVLAGCAAEKEVTFPTTNPLEKACQAEGVQPGNAMKDCMRHKAALALARNVCAGKRLNVNSPQGQNCVKREAEYSEASSQCQAQGLGTESPERIAEFKACITGKAPEAAAYEFGKNT